MKANEEYLTEMYQKYTEVAKGKYKDEFYQMKFKESKRKPLKMVVTFVLTIVVMVGIAYATNIRNTQEEKKIWKEPERHEWVEHEMMTEEEVSKCLSEEEAKNLGSQVLIKMGLEGETIQTMQLQKNFFSKENEWQMASQKATITLEAETGKLKSIQVPTWNYKIPYDYGITRQEAKEVAKELLEKYRPQGDTGEYELVKLTRNMETDEASYIWYAQFNKKYEDLLNPYEEIQIGWIPTINGIYSLSIKRGVYEKNPEKIKKEKAIEIAKEKDKQIEPEKVIKGVEAEVRIRQMNEEVYLRENYKEEYDNHEFLKYGTTQFQTEERVRKVWCVVLTYDEENKSDTEKYTYFVDCTTGEIIGGHWWSDLDNEKIMREDPYNFAGKD